jgi:FAD binding domain-containing protein/D-arabinono-1,4-lactone oxidase
MSTRTFTNWNGSASSSPRAVAVPRHVDHLVAVVRDTDAYPSPLRVGGSLHSMNACFATTGTQVLLSNFDQVGVDTNAMTITVGAAVTMVRIRDVLRPRGLETEVTPEIGNATAGSVACCGTKDAAIGNGLAQVSSTVIGVKLVDAQGRVQTVTDSDEPERMREIRSSYGLLGLIFEVTFRIRPAVMLRYDYASFPLDPVPTREQLLGGAEGMLGLVQPYANRIVVERRWVVGDGRRRVSRFSTVKRTIRDKLWETGTSALPTLLPFNPVFDVLDYGVWLVLRGLGLLGGFRARRYDSTIEFKSKRWHYFDFTFWALPVSRWAEFIPAYLRFCQDFKRETRFRVSLISEAYLMAADGHSLLSPTAREEAFTMDVTDTRMNDPRWRDFNVRFNTLIAGFGGRPLLNQTKELTAEIVARTLGDDWERFFAIRRQEDPEGRFLSDYFRELAGPAGS